MLYRVIRDRIVLASRFCVKCRLKGDIIIGYQVSDAKKDPVRRRYILKGEITCNAAHVRVDAEYFLRKRYHVALGSLQYCEIRTKGLTVSEMSSGVSRSMDKRCCLHEATNRLYLDATESGSW